MEHDQNKIQELQMLEQNLQNILMQKQAFQMELSESIAALKEIEKSGDEVFKIVGQLMIKSDKKKMIEELKNKEKILSLRTKTIEKQENSLTEQLQKLQEEIMKGMKQ
jgi:prefoldin beta subunit